MNLRDDKSLPPTPDWLALITILVGGGICALLVYNAPLLGHDWMVGFVRQTFDYQYPPWVTLILRPLTSLPPRIGLAVMNGLTLSSVAVLSYRYARHTFPASYAPAILALLFALFNSIPWMILWLGQIEVMVLLGLAILPVGIPLLFAKPHLGLWAGLGSRRDFVWMMIMLVISLVMWGIWPVSLLSQTLGYRVPHPTSMGWSTLHPVIGVMGLVLLLFTTRDPLRLMAAGSFVSPFLMPYHYYILLPALGRTRGYRQLALWLASQWMIVVAGMPIIPIKMVALVFPLLVWATLAPTLRPRAMLADPDLFLNRIRATVRQARLWLARPRLV
jgi:hypothetical protein